MVMELPPSQVKNMTDEEANSVSDMDSKLKLVAGKEPKEPIKFGILADTKVADGPPEREMDPNEVNEVPKNAVDEWPEPKKIHAFYFVRYRPYDDPNVKAKIDQADKEIQKKRQERSQIIDLLKTKRSDRADVITQLKPLVTEDRSYRAVIDEKRKEMMPFQAALSQLRTVESTRKSEGLCSSEEELVEVIRSLHFRLQHESNTIAEEKQMLKEIKYLEGTRDKVIANAAKTAKIGDSYGQKNEMQGQVKLLGVNLDAVRKDQQTVRSKIKKLEEKLKLIDDDIASLEKDLAGVDEKINKAYENIREFRRANNETNACFQQNRVLLNNVRELAAKKDITSLEELHHAEVENFMSEWNSKKSFRNDYERRILASLDARQLSRDGRMRNFDEKPIVLEVARPMEVELPRITSKKLRDDFSQPVQHDALLTRKTHKEDAKKSNDMETKGKIGTPEDVEYSSLPDSSIKESAKLNENDDAKLKEMKKAEEIAKAKQAFERKKIQAEKAAAYAQKEAEKKLKEKEKKARKKAAPSADSESVEQAADEPQAEEPNEPEIKEAPIQVKTKEPSARYRGRQKGSNQPPKTMLSRKKAQPQPYWIWAAAGAAVLVAIAGLGFYYTSLK